MANLLPTEIYGVIFCLFLVWFGWQKYANQSSDGKKKVVAYVKEICTHPVKSAKPFHQKEIDVTHLGLKHDRQFAVLNKHGTFVTLRKYPKFVLIKQEILEDQIRLTADGMENYLYLPLHMKKEDGDHMADVTIWTIKTKGVHVSDEVDQWFSEFLGLDGCKLYCFPTDGEPRRTRDKGQYEIFENYDNTPNTMMFSDGSPVMIASQESLDKLNTDYTDECLTMDRFRPNLVLTGCPPYAEDNFGRIQIGDSVIMEGVYPSERCVAINVLPDKGVMSEKSILKYLSEKRSGPKISPYAFKLKGGFFGFNYGVRRPGHIKVGDPVYQLE